MPDSRVDTIIAGLEAQMRDAGIYCEGPAVPWKTALDIAVAAVREAAQPDYPYPHEDGDFLVIGPECFTDDAAPFFTEQQERALSRCEGYDAGFAAGCAADQHLRGALDRIERLVAKWDAPIRYSTDDRIAYEKWAAVGSEAHKIAADALAAADREAPDEETKR